ncbi:hypothetical protein Q7C36_000033 [Tachysurus vachellii]|uniref:G-protein coupled receptors family 1 profile domain-containing protein n=1 Tax=Tachysurus vachellii TaxID=175792 RepID=A0AA88NVA3_TACVA|nr:hypothetical protein Q7C36_000033 [Tachysurus vachellii]
MNNILLDVVKACVHAVVLLVVGVLTYVILVTIRGSRYLHHKVRYHLLLQHCICLTVFNAVGSVIHGIRSLHLPITRLTCWILSDLQVVFGGGITFTLTLMGMCMCFAVCCPLKFEPLVNNYYHLLIILAWFMALINPLVYTALAFVQKSWHYVISPDEKCPTALEGTGFSISVLLFLNIMVMLIFSSYFLICLEGHQLGHFSWSNRRARRTILIHMLQIILYLVPTYIVISGMHMEIAGEIVTFVLFSMSQVLSPIIYGLQCEELSTEIPHLIPKCCYECVTHEPGASGEQRESPGTSRRPSVAVISTGTSTNPCTINLHVSAKESDEKDNDHISEEYEETLV